MENDFLFLRCKKCGMVMELNYAIDHMTSFWYNKIFRIGWIPFINKHLHGEFTVVRSET